MEDKLNKILNVIGSVLVNDARTNMTKGKKNASYGTVNSIRYVVKETTDGLELNLIMNESGLFVLGGRGKGKTPPPTDAIVKWIKDKNLVRKFLGTKGNTNPNNPAYADQIRFIAMKIAKKIGANGIPAFNFLSPTKVVFIGPKQAYLQLPKEYLKQIVDAYKAETQEKINTSVYRQLVPMMK